MNEKQLVWKPANCLGVTQNEFFGVALLRIISNFSVWFSPGSLNHDLSPDFPPQSITFWGGKKNMQVIEKKN